MRLPVGGDGAAAAALAPDILPGQKQVIKPAAIVHKR